MKIQNVPFLTVSEFVRAKLKTWVMYAVLTCCYFLANLFNSRGSERDAQDIIYILGRYWNRIDINRIPEQDMNLFVARNVTAAPSWAALRRKYGMWFKTRFGLENVWRRWGLCCLGWDRITGNRKRFSLKMCLIHYVSFTHKFCRQNGVP